MDNNDWDLFAIVRSCKANTFTPQATISETPHLPPTLTTTSTTTNNIMSHQKATPSYLDNFTFAHRNNLISFATTTIPIPTTTIPTSTFPIIITNTTSFPTTTIPTLSTTTIPEKITTTTNTMTNTNTGVQYLNQSSSFFNIPSFIEQQLMQPNQLTELEKLKHNFNHNTIIPIPTTTIHTFNFATQTTNNTTVTPIYTTRTFTTPNLTSTTRTPITTTVTPTTTVIPTIITNNTSSPTTTIPTFSTTTTPKKITTTTMTTPIYTTTTFTTPTATIRTPTSTRFTPTTTTFPTIITNTTSSPTTIIPTISTTAIPTYTTTTTTNTITNINNSVHNSNQSSTFFDIPTLIKQQNELIEIEKLKLNFNHNTTIPIPTTTFHSFDITNPNTTNTTIIPIYTTMTFTTPTSTIPIQTTTTAAPTTTTIPKIITNTTSSPITTMPTLSTTNTITNINNSVHNSNQSSTFFDISTLIKQQNELIEIEKLKLNFNHNTTIPIPTTTFHSFDITNPNTTNTTTIPIYTTMTFTTPPSTIPIQTTTTAAPTSTTIPKIITNTTSSPITTMPTLSTTTTTNTITNTNTSVHYSNKSSTFFDFPTFIEQQPMQPNELTELKKFELDFNSNTIIPMPTTTISTFNIITPTTTTPITPIYTTTTFTTPTPTSTICTPATTTGTPTMNNINISVRGTNHYPTISHFPMPIKQQIQSNSNNQVSIPKYVTGLKFTTTHFDRAYNHPPVPQQLPIESNQLSLVPQINSQVLSNTHLQEPKHKSRKRKNNDHMRFEGHVIVEKPKEDSWTWKKYGEKPISGSPHPRSYYKCTSFRDCPARKLVQKSKTKENTYVVTYNGEHNHDQPTDNLNSVIGTSWNKKSQTRLPAAGEAGSSSNVGNFHFPDVKMLQFDQPESSNARVLIGQSKISYPETELIESHLHAGGEARSFSNVRNMGPPNVMTLQFDESFTGESSDIKFTGSLYDDYDILIEKMKTILEDFLLDFNHLRALFP